MKASQREKGFVGGIPVGLSATSDSSRAMEIALRQAIGDVEICRLATSYGFHHVKYINGKTLGKMVNVPPGVQLSGLSPDGGIWVDDDGIPVLSSEAKRQGKFGNAIERFFKNHTLLESLNGSIVNLVFCRGDGFFNNNSAQSIMQGVFCAKTAVKDGDEIWNSHVGESIRMYRFKDSDFDTPQYIFDRIKEAHLLGLEEAYKRKKEHHENDRTTLHVGGREAQAHQAL